MDQGPQGGGETDTLELPQFRANEVRLWLSVIAYNLGNVWRRLGLPKRIDTWSLTNLQQRLIRTGGRPVKHARYNWLLLAERSREEVTGFGGKQPGRARREAG